MPPAQSKLMPIAGGVEARFDLIERLRGRIRAIEQAPMSAPFLPREETSRPPPWTFGAAAIDDALLGHSLSLAGVHEVQAISYRDSWAALGFALALLARRMASLPAGDESLGLWIFTQRMGREFGRPYGPGLAALGLDPGKLLMVETGCDGDAAWALEEGLKARALAILLGHIDAANWTLGRRLALVAQAYRTPCLIVSSSISPGLGAALTRWRVAALVSSPDPFDKSAPGAARWRISLERCRWGASGLTWNVEWNNGAHDFRLAAPLVDRTVKARDEGEVARRLAG